MILLEHIAISCSKVFIGWCCCLILGFILALAKALSPNYLQSNKVLNLILDLIRFPPPIAWIPFVILLFGISFSSAILIIVIGGTPPFFTILYDCIANVENKYVLLSNSLGLNRLKSIFYIYLPSQLPQIYSASKVSLGMCWMSIIASEMISSQSGLGYLIQIHRINLDYKGILLDILAIALCGYGMNFCITSLEKFHLGRYKK